MSNYTLSEEVAESQFAILLDYYDIEFEDYKGVSINGNDAFDALSVSRRKILKAIRRGQIEIISDEGEPLVIQTLKGKYPAFERIEYKVLTGRSKIAMAQFKDENAKMHALLASLSGVKSSEIQSLKGPDLSIAECLGGLFLLA